MYNNKKFVVLRNRDTGEKFFTINDGSDPTRLIDGTIAYSIIAYVDTVEEAQKKLYGTGLLFYRNNLFMEESG